MTLNCDKPNRYFLTVFGEVVMLSNIINTEHGIVLVGKKFKQLQDFYNYPLPSSSIDIYKVKTKSDSITIGNYRMSKQNVWPFLL